MGDPPFTDKEEKSRPDMGVGIMSTVIFCGAFLIYPMLICGCHFHLSAAIVTFVPVAWSVWLLASYETKLGKYGAWFAFLVACTWLWVGYESNLKHIL